jgi:hypothetical protein
LPAEAFEVGEDRPWISLILVAAADGLGPDWVALKRPPDEDVVLRLVDDSAPIEGRFLDLQGRPVVGAKVTRGRIKAEGLEGIDPYLKLLRDDPFRASNHNFAMNYWSGMRLPGQPASVTTDAEGRFRLAGIGRNRIVEIDVEGPAIQGATITAMTRKSAAVSTPKDADAVTARTIYGATFDHLLPPGRALTGVVRDRHTGRPLAGVNVSGEGTNARTTTDADGRYTLPGFPKGDRYALAILAGHKPPYFVTRSASTRSRPMSSACRASPCGSGWSTRRRAGRRRGCKSRTGRSTPTRRSATSQASPRSTERAHTTQGCDRTTGPICWVSYPAPGRCSSARPRASTARPASTPRRSSGSRK